MSKNIRGSKRKPKRVAAGKSRIDRSKPVISKGEIIYYSFMWSVVMALLTGILISSTSISMMFVGSFLILGVISFVVYWMSCLEEL